MSETSVLINSSQSYEAAIALVKPANNTSSNYGEPSQQSGDTEAPPASQVSSTRASADLDPDLQRANELVSLHYDVKMKYLQNGPDPEFIKARKDVEGVLYDLNRAIR